MSEKVVIIIPTYNEALVIEETITAIFSATQAIMDFDIHILVFDSHSTDLTATIVQRLMTTYPRLHLLTEPQKSGLGSAYLQSMHYVLNHLNAEIIIEFDADLSHQPKYLAPILLKIKQYDVVVGSRYIKDGSIPKNWGWHRRTISKVGNYISRLLLTPRYKDFTSGFRATRSRALKQALPKAFLSHHYAYKIELLWRLHRNRATIVEHPITFVDREKGYSKLPSNSILDSLRVLFILRYRAMKQYLSMCAVGGAGIVIQCTAYNLLRSYLSPLHAMQIAVMLAILNNFFLNKTFTFKKNKWRKSSQAIKAFATFILYSICMIQMQSHWMNEWVKQLNPSYLEENLIMLSGLVIGSLLNYFVYSRFIWQRDLSSI